MNAQFYQRMQELLMVTHGAMAKTTIGDEEVKPLIPSIDLTQDF